MARRVNRAARAALAAWRRLVGNGGEPMAIERLARAWKRKAARPVYRFDLGGGAGVIAKPCSAEEAERERLVHEQILPRLSLAGPRLLGVVGEDDGDGRWIFLEAARGEEYRPEQGAHRRLAGAWLATLHVEASCVGEATAVARLDYAYDAESAALRQHLETLVARLGASAGAPAAPAGERRFLAGLARRCEELAGRWPEVAAYAGRFGRTLVHGDLCVSNLLVGGDAGDARLIVFDWQRSGWAAPAFDLTRFLGSWAAPDLEAYLGVARRRWPALDAAAVRRLGYVGEAVRWIDAARWEVERLAAGERERPLRRLRLYADWMEAIRRAAPWTDNPALAEGEWRSVVPYGRPRRLRDGMAVHA